MRLLTLPLVFLSALGWAQVQIAYKAEPGTSSRKLLTVVTEGPRGDVTLTGTLVKRIAAKNEDGTLVQETLLEGVTIVAGETRQVFAELPMPLTRLDPQGRVLEQFGDDANAETLLQDRLLAIVLPVKTLHTGDSWTHTEPTSNEVPQVGTIYRYVSRELVGKVDCARIAWSASAQGSQTIGAHGTAWIAVATGEIVKLDVKIDNLPLGGEPVKASIEIRPIT